MRQPSQFSLLNALDILIRSIEDENGPDYPVSWHNERQISQTSFAQVDRAQEALELACTSLQDAVAAQTILLGRQRNSLTSIHQIPAELLHKILWECVEQSALSSTRARRLQELSAVSRVWWQAIRSTPMLWTTITPVEPIALTLRKSGSALLDIDNFYFASVAEPLMSVSQFVDMVGPHSARWKSFAFLGPMNENLRQILNSPLPNLGTLRIFPLGGPTRTHALTLGGCTRLGYLEVASMRLPWTSLPTSNLRTLSLRNTTISTAEAMLLLGSCPNLVDCRLHTIVTKSTANSSSPIPPTSLQLQKLRTFHLVDIPLEMAISLFRRCSVPRLKELELRVGATDDDPTALVQGLGEGCVLKRILENTGVGEMKISISDTRVEVYVGWYTQIVLQGSKAGWVEHAGAHLHQLFSLHGTRVSAELTISRPLTSHGMPFLDWPLLFNVMRVEVEPWEILDHLSRPRKQADGALEWSCPHLEKLVLVTEEAFDVDIIPYTTAAVIKMVKARDGAVVTSNGIGSRIRQVRVIGELSNEIVEYNRVSGAFE